MNNNSPVFNYGIASIQQSAQSSQSDASQSSASAQRSRVIRSNARSSPLTARPYPLFHYEADYPNQQQNPTTPNNQPVPVSQTDQSGRTKRTSEHLEQFDPESAKPEDTSQHCQAPQLFSEEQRENGISANASGSKMLKTNNSNMSLSLDPALRNNSPSPGPSGGGSGDDGREDFFKSSDNNLAVKFKDPRNQGVGLNWKIKLDGHFRVEDFTVQHITFGEVEFMGIVDLAKLTTDRPIDIAKFVKFRHGGLQVLDAPSSYALQQVPLNITFRGITRQDIIDQNQTKLKEPISKEELNKMVQMLGDLYGAVFSQYDEDKQVWNLLLPPVDQRKPKNGNTS